MHKLYNFLLKEQQLSFYKLVFIFLIPCNSFAQPVINNFLPRSGPIGTTVIISGNNFSPVPANNVVFFGGVKATVSAATLTSLTVTVPPSATYDPIAVTVNQLTGYSAMPFITTFGCGNPLTPVSFSPGIKFPTTGASWHFARGDLDGDGKPDLAYGDWYSNIVSVYRNTSVPGNISMATRIDLITGTHPDDVVICDFNADGKPDMVTVNTQGALTDNISVFKNTSTTGNISFDPNFNLASGLLQGDKLATGDIDGDGKPDLIVSYGESQKFSILKNTSMNEVISFAPPLIVNIAAGVEPGFITASDIDGDGKLDIAFNAYYNTLYVLRNTSTGSIISFAPEIELETGKFPLGIVSTDIDGDTKPDILTANSSDTTISVFRNTSTPGNISFAPIFNYSVAPGKPRDLAVDDADGDGKPDIITTSSGLLLVIKNNSSIGTLSFAPAQKYTISNVPVNVNTADIDGDSKTDILGGLGSSTNGGGILILQNQLCIQIPFCPGGNNSLPSPLTGTSYQWQVNSGSGYANLSNDSHYANVNSNLLQLTNIPSSWYGYKYRCVVDGNNSAELKILFINQWTGAVSTAWEDPLNWSCNAVPDNFTDVYIQSGNVVLSSTTTVGSLTTSPGVHVTVVAGNILTVLH